MRISLLLLITLLTYQTNAQTDEELIRAEAVNFSNYMMEGNRAKIVAMYTDDAKIFPTNREILEDDDLVEYWNPKDPGNWKTIYHKLTPLEIKVWGDEAYDFGYYEGESTNGEEISQWKGKYVIIWKKIDGKWKMYLDIWNRINS